MMYFEREIKKRILILTFWSIICAVLLTVAFVLKQSGIYGTKGPSVAVIIGLFAGIEITSILRIRNYQKALKNNDSLEELHIKETDERNRMLALNTCRSCIYSAFTLLGFISIITSFIDQTVFLTVSAVLILLVGMYLLLLFYYSRKY